MKKQFDTSNLLTVAIISDNLGKYGYKFDSAKNQLIKVIKDSTKTTIVGQDPVLIISDFGNGKGIQFHKKQDNELIYKGILISQDAGSTNFNLLVSVATIDFNDQLNYIGKDYPIEKKDRIAKDWATTFYMRLPDSKFKLFGLWIRGTYGNTDKSKEFEVNSTYFFNSITNSFGVLKGDTRNTIIEFIKNAEK